MTGDSYMLIFAADAAPQVGDKLTAQDPRYSYLTTLILNVVHVGEPYRGVLLNPRRPLLRDVAAVATFDPQAGLRTHPMLNATTRHEMITGWENELRKLGRT